MNTKIVLPAMALLVLLGSGCTTTIAICDQPTTHGSCIEQGIDSALIGTWRLEEQVIGSPAGTFVHPYSGRLLSFNIIQEELLDGDGNDSGYFEEVGSYLDEYSTETDSGGSGLGALNGCTVSGASGGDWSASVAMVSSDPTDPAAPLMAVNELTAIKTATYSQPTITCPTGIGSNRPSTPLGEAAPGPYLYSISGDGASLTISQSNPFANTSITYSFSRVIGY